MRGRVYSVPGPVRKGHIFLPGVESDQSIVFWVHNRLLPDSKQDCLLLLLQRPSPVLSIGRSPGILHLLPPGLLHLLRPLHRQLHLPQLPGHRPRYLNLRSLPGQVQLGQQPLSAPLVPHLLRQPLCVVRTGLQIGGRRVRSGNC